jgi:lipid-A-disaccharide synthase-like uncharacterized protein
MKNILKDWFTAPSNEHYEAVRSLWFLSVFGGNRLFLACIESGDGRPVCVSRVGVGILPLCLYLVHAFW